MSDYVRRFMTDESGSAALEYGLIAAGLSVAILAVLQGIGLRMAGNFATPQGSLR